MIKIRNKFYRGNGVFCNLLLVFVDGNIISDIGDV